MILSFYIEISNVPFWTEVYINIKSRISLPSSKDLMCYEMAEWYIYFNSFIHFTVFQDIQIYEQLQHKWYINRLVQTSGWHKQKGSMLQMINLRTSLQSHLWLVCLLKQKQIFLPMENCKNVTAENWALKF